MKSVFEETSLSVLQETAGVKLKMYEKRIKYYLFNSSLISIGAVFSVVEMVSWSWLEHVGIYREIPSEFVNHKQIKKINIAANKAP